MGYHERLAALVLGKLIGGSTTAGCSSPSENTRKLAGKGQTRLGWWDGTETPPAWLAELREAPWFGNWELNIEKSLLEKLAVNSIINPMTALMNITNGELIDDSYKTTLHCAIREVADIFHWSGHSDIADNLHQRVFNVIDDTAFNSSSMRIDRQRHTQTEHEEILGHLLESFGETTTLEKPATHVYRRTRLRPLHVCAVVRSSSQWSGSCPSADVYSVTRTSGLGVRHY